MQEFLLIEDLLYALMSVEGAHIKRRVLKALTTGGSAAPTTSAQQ